MAPVVVKKKLPLHVRSLRERWGVVQLGKKQVETRKFGRNETRAFQGCSLDAPGVIVSFLMKRASKADCLFLFPQ